MISVPDLYVAEVDGCRYHYNKHDLTLSPPGANNNDDEESDSNNHHADQNVSMATVVMPTLCPGPQGKFPRMPVQAMQQKDFDL